MKRSINRCINNLMMHVGFLPSKQSHICDYFWINNPENDNCKKSPNCWLCTYVLLEMHPLQRAKIHLKQKGFITRKAFSVLEKDDNY